MIKKANMCILFRDEVVDIVYIDNSVLGTQIKCMERLPRDENLFAAVAELLAKTEKTPSRVTLCVPRDIVMQRTLNYPIAVRDDIGSMIQFEASRHVPFAENDRLLGYTTQDSADEKQIVLNLLAARKSEIHALVDGFTAAGVPVDEAVSFSSLLSPELSTVSTLLALVDVKHIELCIYGNGMLRDSQIIRRDAPGFSEERVITTARQMAAKHKDWLGDEGIGRILVGGAEVLSDTFEPDLGTAFGLHVHPFEIPASLSNLAFDPKYTEAVLASAIELSPTLNLIEDKQRKVPISKRTWVLFILATLFLLEISTAYALKISAPTRQRKKVALQIEAMQEQTASIQKMKAKNNALKKQLYRLSKVCSSHISAMEILQKISDTLPEDSYLQQCSFDADGLQLKGYSKEPDKLPELILAIPLVNTLSTSEIGKKENDFHEFTLGVTLRSTGNE